MECVVATVVVGKDTEATYALVTDVKQLLILQKRWRIYGTAEDAGSTPQRLRLALEEMAVGVSTGFLRLEGSMGVEKEVEEITRQLASGEQCDEGIDGAAWTIPPRRRLRLRVFQDLWERGYIVTFGSKFGADFLIYKDDPKRSHALALIVVKNYEEEFARVDIVSFCRVAKMVKKQLLFACVHPDSEDKGADRQEGDGESGSAKAGKRRVVYISLTHALLASRQDEGAE